MQDIMQVSTSQIEASNIQLWAHQTQQLRRGRLIVFTESFMASGMVFISKPTTASYLRHSPSQKTSTATMIQRHLFYFTGGGGIDVHLIH